MSCIHHWKIGEPEGPTSIGSCCLCGATRDFNNYIPEAEFENFTISKKRGLRNSIKTQRELVATGRGAWGGRNGFRRLA